MCGGSGLSRDGDWHLLGERRRKKPCAGDTRCGQLGVSVSRKLSSVAPSRKPGAKEVVI